MFMCTQWIPTILSVNLLPFNVNVGGSNILCSHQGTYLMRIDDKDYATTPLTSIGGLNASYNCPFQSTTTFQPDRPTEILIMPFLWLALGFMRYTHSCFWSRLLTCHYLIQGPDCWHQCDPFVSSQMVGPQLFNIFNSHAIHPPIRTWLISWITGHTNIGSLNCPFRRWTKKVSSWLSLSTVLVS